MESKPSTSATAKIIDSNDNSSLKSSPTPWKPKCFQPGFMRYTSEFLGFISKVKETSPETGTNDEPKHAPNRYVFRSGLHNPQICPRISEINIPSNAKIFPNDYPRHGRDCTFYNFMLNKLACVKERSPWGFETKLVDVESYIPCDIEEVRKQQLNMAPIMQYINWNPELLQRVKPKFVCNRYILKGIMMLQQPTYSFSFLAEKKDGVIYLRELYKARPNAFNKEGCAANIVTSVILSAHKDGKKTPIDLNEATYGAYVGHVGPDISVLFTAELDAFWGPLKEKPNGEVDSTGLENKIVELKTTHQYLWSNRNWDHWKTVLAMTWAQCHLIGTKDVIASVLLDTGDVGQVLRFQVNSILDDIKDYNGHSGTHRESFFFNRLHSTLKTLLEKVTEDTPAVYYVNVFHPTEGNVITEVSNFSNFPSIKFCKAQVTNRTNSN